MRKVQAITGGNIERTNHLTRIEAEDLIGSTPSKIFDLKISLESEHDIWYLALAM